MITFADMRKMLAPIRRRIFLLIGRALLTAVDNDTKLMHITMTALKGETITDADRVQDYGFESYPLERAQPVFLAVGGNREHAIAIVVPDRRYRPHYTSAGDAVVYTYKDERDDGTPGVGHRVWLIADGEIMQQDGEQAVIKFRTDRLIETPLTTHNGNYQINGNLTVSGNITSTGGNITADTGNVGATVGHVNDFKRTMSGDRQIYNSHVHPEVFSSPVAFDAPDTKLTVQKQ